MSQTSALKWIANSDKTCLKIIQNLQQWAASHQVPGQQMAHFGDNFYYLEVQESELILHTIDLRGLQPDSIDKFQLEVIEVYTSFTYEIEVNELNIALRLNKGGQTKMFLTSLKTLTSSRYLPEASNILQTSFHPLNPNYFVILTAAKIAQINFSQVSKSSSKNQPDQQMMIIYDIEKPELIIQKILFRLNFDLRGFSFPHKSDVKDTLVYLLNKEGTVYYHNLLLDNLQVNQATYEQFTQKNDFLKKQSSYKLVYSQKALVPINQLEEIHQSSIIKDETIKSKLKHGSAIIKLQDSIYIIFSQHPKWSKFHISILSQTQKLVEIVYQTEINLEKSEIQKLHLHSSQEFNIVYAQIGTFLILINYNALIVSNTNDVIVSQTTVGECQQFLVMNYSYMDTIFMKKKQFQYLNQSQLHLLQKDDQPLDFSQVDDSSNQQSSTYLQYKGKLENFKKSIKHCTIIFIIDIQMLESVKTETELEELNKLIKKQIESDLNQTARTIKQQYNLLHSNEEILNHTDDIVSLNKKITLQKKQIKANNEEILNLLDNGQRFELQSELQGMVEVDEMEKEKTALEQDYLNVKYEFEQLIKDVSTEDLEYIQQSLGDWINKVAKEK